jgi:hypothetical protein
MNWNVEREMVDELVAAGIPGVDSKLKAMAVFQHCAVHDLSLFDFLSTTSIVGFSLAAVPSLISGGEGHGEAALPLSLPSAAAFAEGEFPEPGTDFVESEPAAVCWKFSDWRDDASQSSHWRLERLRKHIAEVRLSPDHRELLESLISHERKLAKICEPVPTLGMVADDPVEGGDFLNEDEDSGVSIQDSESQISNMKSEPDSIAAVLANPKSATVAPSTERKNSAGQVLVSDQTLANLYEAAKRIGFTEIAAQEAVCRKNSLRVIVDMTEAAALKFIENMKKRAAAV